MDKLKMHSPDMTQENIKKIQALFPNCVTEARDENGKLRLAIDFDQLKQELSDSFVEGPQERYHLNWPGKREALLTANTPIAKTLRPNRRYSVNFEDTSNIFIEGDNLDALKLLQNGYLGRVKAIYIDPPYNTGRDFIYNDDFSARSENYLKDSNQINDAGDRLYANTESNGRFHSDWLSMMYSRLKLARSILADNGVIFISIDDEELVNLKKICDEIFGEQNFVETFIWVKKTAPNNVIVGSVHEYILMYVKDSTKAELFLLPRDAQKDKDYKNPDNDPRGRWKPDNLTAAAKGGRATPSLRYKVVNPNTGQEHWPPEGRMWAVNKEDMNKKIAEGTVYWGKNGDGRPMDKRFLSQTRDGTVAQTLLNDVGSNSSASKYLNQLFDGYVVFETPKPVELIERLLRISTRDNDIVFDFFAGSCATAEAVFKLNAEDGGRRRFMVVQLDEALKENSEGRKIGCKSVADIGRLRIEKVAETIRSEIDKGFRFFKIDSSNFKDVYYSPESVTQHSLALENDYIKEDRAHDDLLIQVLIDWGIEVSAKIEKIEVMGKSIYQVEGDSLIACFEKELSEALIKAIAKYKPLRVVLRDDSFATDATKINFEQIFSQLSPNTEVKTI